MPIEYDVKQDAFYKEGVEDERKRMEEERKRMEDERKRIEEEKQREKKIFISKLIKSEKFTFQEIADLTDSELSLVEKISQNN